VRITSMEVPSSRDSTNALTTSAVALLR